MLASGPTRAGGGPRRRSKRSTTPATLPVVSSPAIAGHNNAQRRSTGQGCGSWCSGVQGFPRCSSITSALSGPSTSGAGASGGANNEDPSAVSGHSWRSTAAGPAHPPRPPHHPSLLAPHSSTELPHRIAAAEGTSIAAAASGDGAASGGGGAAAAGGDDSEAALRALASMAQLASAWAQVSSRLAPAPGTPPTRAPPGGTDAADAGPAAVATHPPDARGGDGGGVAGGGGGGETGAADVNEWRGQDQQPGRQERGRDAAVVADGYPTGAAATATTTAAAVAAATATTSTALAPAPGAKPQPHHHNHHNHSHHTHAQTQTQHFEAVITALKLALSSLHAAPPRADGRLPAARAVQLASSLAELVAAGLPLDADSLCAGVVAEAAALGALGPDRIRASLGHAVAGLVHDMLRVRGAPRRVELLDDEAAGAVREWCLAFHDVRSCVLEVVHCWDELQHMEALPPFEQQALALEALQVGAPLGHALGLGPLSLTMEDACLKVLFPGSYSATSAWLRGLMAPAEEGLFAAQQALLSALEAHPEFGKLAGGCVVKARTKSLFSVMKKLLHLGDMAKGGRRREELYDLLGMRAIVQPAAFLPPGEAEAAATRACYIVQEVACRLWRPLPNRSKDYIVSPKPNGYQSIHLTLQLGQPATPPPAWAPASASYDGSPYGAAAAAAPPPRGAAAPAASAGAMTDFTVSSGSSSDEGAGGDADGGGGGEPLFVELQIRTSAMDGAAESGDASHAVYKGGLDARTARQLQAWTQELRARLAAQPRGRLLLRAAAGPRSDLSADEAAALAERRRRRRERRAALASAAAANANAAAAAGAAPATAAAALPAAAPVVAAAAGDHGSDADAAEERMPAASPSGSHVFTSFDAAAASAAPALPSAQAASPQLLPPPHRRVAAPPHLHSHSAPKPPSPPSSPAAAAAAATHGSAAAAAAAAAHAGGPAIHPAPGSLLPPPARRASHPEPSDTSGHAAHSAAGRAAGKALGHPPGTGGAKPSPHAAAAAAVAAAAAGGASRPSLDARPVLLPARHLHHTASAAAAGAAAPPPAVPTEGQQLRPPGSPHGHGHGYSQPPPHPPAAPNSIAASPPAAPAAASSSPSAPPSPSQSPAASQPPAAQPPAAPPAPPAPLLVLSSLEGSVDEGDEGPGGGGGGMGGGPLALGLPHMDAVAAAEQLFRALDANGDGRLSMGEVRRALADLAPPASERDAAALMAALDADGDGGVSCEEFVAGLRRAADQQQDRERERERKRVEREQREAAAAAAARQREWGREQQPWQPWQQH